MRLIHITDPHLSSLHHLSFFKVQGKRRSGFLSWQRKRRHIHQRIVLDQLCEHIRAASADLILLTGDLVHIGMENEIQQAASWLRELGTPEEVMFVPGNHDVYASDSWSHIRKHWSDYLPADLVDAYSGYPIVRNMDGIQLIGVTTACVTPVFSARGNLGESQRSRLSKLLADQNKTNPLRFLLIHHPPLPGMTKWRKALKDANELQKIVFRDTPDLAVYGHTHKNREFRNRGETAETRIFSTASASSINSASFRIFDLTKISGGWQVEMRLRSIATGNRPGTYEFPVEQEYSWEIRKE